MDPAFRPNANCSGFVVEGGASRQWQEPGWGVSYLVEIVRVAARVGDVLELLPECRVEREDVLVCLNGLSISKAPLQ